MAAGWLWGIFPSPQAARTATWGHCIISPSTFPSRLIGSPTDLATLLSAGPGTAFLQPLPIPSSLGAAHPRQRGRISEIRFLNYLDFQGADKACKMLFEAPRE